MRVHCEKMTTSSNATAQVGVGIDVLGSIRTELLQTGNKNPNMYLSILNHVLFFWCIIHGPWKLAFYSELSSTSIAYEIKRICIMHGD